MHILEHAQKEFGPIYQEFSELANIPFHDRSKPLMRVPQMTSEEEQWLYESGVGSLHQLLVTRQTPTARIPAERFQFLRNSARHLRISRYKLAAGLMTVVICVICAGSVFARLVQGPAPKLSAPPSVPDFGAANPYK